MKYFEYGLACDDCTIAIANDDYTGMNNAQAKATRAGIEAVGEYLIVGDEERECWQRCDVCGSGACENMHRVGYLR